MTQNLGLGLHSGWFECSYGKDINYLISLVMVHWRFLEMALFDRSQMTFYAYLRPISISYNYGLFVLQNIDQKPRFRYSTCICGHVGDDALEFQ